MGVGVERGWGQGTNTPPTTTPNLSTFGAPIDYDALSKYELKTKCGENDEDAQAMGFKNHKHCSYCIAHPESTKECPTTKSDRNETETKCTAAFEKYEKARKASPCPKAATSKACQEQIAACSASTGLISATGITTGNDQADTVVDKAFEMIKASQSTNQNSATNFQPDRSCYSAIQNRDKDVMKERKSRRDQIIKDIEAADKESREANEKLKKETNEIKVEQQKLQAETTKTLQKLDVEKREKLTKMNEDLQKAATDIRKQTNEIVKIKQAMEKMKFDNQKTMAAYTEEKINQQCKSAIDTAKVCFIKASKGTKFSKDDTCANFSFSGSGTKGTAEMKKKLKQVQEACFEQSNQTVSTIKYDYADKIRNYEMDITEKQKQIEDSNKALEFKKTENESIAKEIETQKSSEQKNLEDQMANFSQKLADLHSTTEAALKSSKDKITRLNLELTDLQAGVLANSVGEPGSQSNYDNVADEANSLLQSLTSATRMAFAACCNSTTDAKTKKKSVVSKDGALGPNCSSLSTEIDDADKVDKASKKKAGNKTNQ